MKISKLLFSLSLLFTMQGCSATQIENEFNAAMQQLGVTDLVNYVDELNDEELATIGTDKYAFTLIKDDDEFVLRQANKSYISINENVDKEIKSIQVVEQANESKYDFAIFQITDTNNKNSYHLLRLFENGEKYIFTELEEATADPLKILRPKDGDLIVMQEFETDKHRYWHASKPEYVMNGPKIYDKALEEEKRRLAFEKEEKERQAAKARAAARNNASSQARSSASSQSSSYSTKAVYVPPKALEIDFDTTIILDERPAETIETTEVPTLILHQ